MTWDVEDSDSDPWFTAKAADRKNVCLHFICSSSQPRMSTKAPSLHSQQTEAVSFNMDQLPHHCSQPAWRS